MKRLVLQEFVEQGQLAAKLGLCMYFFIANMQEQDAYQIPEGSVLDEGITAVLDGLTQWLDQTSLVNSARKEARRMLERLNREQYFTDVKWVL